MYPRNRLAISILVACQVLLAPIVHGFGTNYIEFAHTNSKSTISGDTIKYRFNVEGFPHSTMDDNTMITLSLAVTQSNSRYLDIYLTDPAGNGVLIGYHTHGTDKVCHNCYTTTVADNQPLQNVYEGASNAGCPPTTVTAIGTHWLKAGNANLEAKTLGSTPFATVFAGTTINDQWILSIYDGAVDVGTVYSCSLRLYSISSSSSSSFPVPA